MHLRIDIFAVPGEVAHVLIQVVRAAHAPENRRLIRMFGPDQSVQSIGQQVLGCRDKCLRRKGKECPTLQV